MSEERDKRDDRSEDPSTSASDPSGSAGTPESADASGSSALSGSPDGDSADVGSTRPTGKRTARRSRVAGSSEGDTSAARVSVTKSSQTSVSGSSAARSSVGTRSDREPKRMNIFKRLSKFLREVVAELRKVIWPNRKQMITYTSVVLVFVTFMVAFISGLDLAFIRGVSWLFG